MELLPEVEGLLDALFWDRDDATKRLDALESSSRGVVRGVRGGDPAPERRRPTRKALRWDDETAVDIAASVIAACSGSTARSPGMRSLAGAHKVSVHETDYVEGRLDGAWASGVVMCRALVERAEEMRLAGADVLEVGAGCGVAGFLAARLGARRVTFTDYLPGLLRNLDASVELNRAATRRRVPRQTSRVARGAWPRREIRATDGRGRKLCGERGGARRDGPRSKPGGGRRPRSSSGAACVTRSTPDGTAAGARASRREEELAHPPGARLAGGQGRGGDQRLVDEMRAG